MTTWTLKGNQILRGILVAVLYLLFELKSANGVGLVWIWSFMEFIP